MEGESGLPSHLSQKMDWGKWSSFSSITKDGLGKVVFLLVYHKRWTGESSLPSRLSQKMDWGKQSSFSSITKDGLGKAVFLLVHD